MMFSREHISSSLRHNVMKLVRLSTITGIYVNSLHETGSLTH